MRLLKRLLFLILIVVLSSSVYAQTFDISIKTLESSILYGEIAYYELTITNSGSNPYFSLEVPDSDWIFGYSPEDLVIPIGKSKKINLELTPKKNLENGIYEVGLRIGSKDSVVEELLNVNLLDLNAVYSVALGDSNIPEILDPSQKYLASIVLINNKKEPVTGLEIKLSSDEFLSGSKVLDLGPREKKTLNFELAVPRKTSPRNTKLNVRFVENNKIIYEKDYPLEVMALTPQFQINRGEEKTFLKRKEIFNLHNDANVKHSQKFKVHVESYAKFFTTPSEGAIYESGNYVWDLTLEGDENVEVSVLYDYTLFLTFAIILIILIGLFQYFKPEIFLEKKFSKLHFDEDGNFEDAKIILTMKNKTSQVIRNISVIEIFPEIVSYENREVPGSMKPSSVRRLEHTLKVMWHIPEMHPGEERIIIYYVKAHYKVIGTLRLPATVVSFKKGLGTKKVYSNSLIAYPPKLEKKKEVKDGKSGENT
jgi:hypothetical protein